MTALVDGSKSDTPKPRIRMLIAVYRKEGISTEQFRQYWRETHSKIFLSSTIVKKNIFRYEQMVLNDEIRTLVKTLGNDTVDWDGIAMYEAESYEKISDVFLDTEFIRNVQSSEERFVDRDRAKVIPVDFVSLLNLPS